MVLYQLNSSSFRSTEIARLSLARRAEEAGDFLLLFFLSSLCFIAY